MRVRSCRRVQKKKKIKKRKRKKKTKDSENKKGSFSLPFFSFFLFFLFSLFFLLVQQSNWGFTELKAEFGHGCPLARAAVGRLGLSLALAVALRRLHHATD